ncbi:hypothetical protein Baya_14374 [Bagarius yarrelli]|uniref:Uncharacterized protein n=1 Tax=Bagarius yarrelli TaxID=175774 RepID=A0A556V902_BAGYA|nr:hypothetical protein Baya_14374 [Bagarius yarrelli]
MPQPDTLPCSAPPSRTIKTKTFLIFENPHTKNVMFQQCESSDDRKFMHKEEGTDAESSKKEGEKKEEERRRRGRIYRQS